MKGDSNQKVRLLLVLISVIKIFDAAIDMQSGLFRGNSWVLHSIQDRCLAHIDMM